MGDGFASDESDADAHVVLGHVAPFSLGPLCVEPALRRVSNERGDEEFVQPRVMQVLVALARARGKVLTRDDLIDSCWSGTIVGDDALNRVVSQVRKLAEDIGQGAFSVETVSRVGYRLKCAEGSKAQPAKTRWTRRGRRMLPAWGWTVLIASLLVLVAGSWWLLSAPSRSTMTVQLGDFTAIGDGLPSGIAASILAEHQAALATEEVELLQEHADLRIVGSVERSTGDLLRYVVRLEDLRTGSILWSRASDWPSTDPNTAREFARQTAEILACAVHAARRHRDRLPTPIFSLSLQSCTDWQNGEFGRLLDHARRLTGRAPRYWLGWQQTAYAIGGIEIVSGGLLDPSLRAEAEAAARRVIALLPQDGIGYTHLALALPPGRAFEREVTLRDSIARRANDCDCELEYAALGDFLLQAGRVEEALTAYRQAGDQGPANPLGVWRIAMASYLTGRVAAGNSAVDRAIAQAGGDDGFSRWVRTSAALYTGHWQTAAEHMRGGRADEAAALRASLHALAAGDPVQIGAARAMLEQLPVRPAMETRIVPLLAATGGIDAVFARLEASRAAGTHYAAPGRMPGLTQPILFDPLLQPIWYDPRFPGYLRRAGFIRYWRESGSRPDMCRFNGAPSFCRLLEPARANPTG